jgi:hypothetical protein
MPARITEVNLRTPASRQGLTCPFFSGESDALRPDNTHVWEKTLEIAETQRGPTRS